MSPRAGAAMLSALLVAAAVAPAVADQPIYRFRLGAASQGPGPVDPGPADPGPTDPEPADGFSILFGARTVYEGNLLTFSPRVSGAQGNPGSYEAWDVTSSPSLPSWVGFQSFSYYMPTAPMTLTPPVGSAGDHEFAIALEHPGSGQRGSGTLRVKVLPNPGEDGVVTIVGPNTVREGEPIDLQISHRRYGTVASMSAYAPSTLPKGVVGPSNGSYTGTPHLGSAGTYTFAVQVRQDVNGNGSVFDDAPWVSEPFTLTVTPANALTASVVKDGVDVAQNEVLEYKVKDYVGLDVVANPEYYDSQDRGYRASISPALPDFIELTTDTWRGGISIGGGATDNSQAGTYGPFTVTVTDPTNPDNPLTAQTQTFSIRIDEKLPPPPTPPGSGCIDVVSASPTSCNPGEAGGVAIAPLHFVGGTEFAPDSMVSSGMNGTSPAVTVRFSGGSGVYRACMVSAPPPTDGGVYGLDVNYDMSRKLRGSRGGVSGQRYAFPAMCSTEFTADPTVSNTASFYQQNEGTNEAHVEATTEENFRHTILIQDVGAGYAVWTSGIWTKTVDNVLSDLFSDDDPNLDWVY